MKKTKVIFIMMCFLFLPGCIYLAAMGGVTTRTEYSVAEESDGYYLRIDQWNHGFIVLASGNSVGHIEYHDIIHLHGKKSLYQEKDFEFVDKNGQRDDSDILNSFTGNITLDAENKHVNIVLRYENELDYRLNGTGNYKIIELDKVLTGEDKPPRARQTFTVPDNGFNK